MELVQSKTHNLDDTASWFTYGVKFPSTCSKYDLDLLCSKHQIPSSKKTKQIKVFLNFKNLNNSCSSKWPMIIESTEIYTEDFYRYQNQISVILYKKRKLLANY